MMGLRNSVGVEKWFGFFSAEEAVKGGRHDGWVDDETRVCRFGYEGLVWKEKHGFAGLWWSEILFGIEDAGTR